MILAKLLCASYEVSVSTQHTLFAVVHASESTSSKRAPIRGYDLSESGGQPGYTASAWVCAGGVQDDADTITLTPGDNATCTITNTDANVGEVIFDDSFEQ